MSSHSKTQTIVPFVFQDVADLASDPEKLKKKASSRLPALSRMAVEDAKLLAEAMTEWKPYHHLIAASWDEFCSTYTGHGADVIDQLCKAVAAQPEVKHTLPAAASERVQAAAAATEPDNLLPSGKVNQWSDNLSEHRQESRATVAGVGIVTQRKLDAIARKAPALLEKVKSGELSAHAAAIAAGIIREKTRVEKLKTLWNAATSEERAEFSGWALNNP